MNRLDSYLELIRRPYTKRIKDEVEKILWQIYPRKKRILEVGAGISQWAQWLLKNENFVILNDIDWNVLEQNQYHSSLIAADGQNLSPIKSHSVDLILYIGVLHHMESQTAALKEARRILASGGTILICEPASRSLNWLYYRLRRVVLKLVGLENLRRLIGYVDPDEKQLDEQAVKVMFPQNEYAIKHWTILPFRLPPLRIFKRWELDVRLSQWAENKGWLQGYGTTVLYLIRGR